MKLILATLIALGLGFTTFAADTATKKKEKAPKTEAKQAGPSAEAQDLAKSLTPSQKTKLMDLVNSGDDEALQSLPGIGATRAKQIKAARPIAEPADLTNVEGIGDATFAQIVAHAKAGFPVPEKKEAAAAPSKKKTAKAEPKEDVKTAKK